MTMMTVTAHLAVWTNGPRYLACSTPCEATILVGVTPMRHRVEPVSLHVFAGVERPKGSGSVKLAAADGPRVDEKPRFSVGEPGFRVVVLAKIG